MKPERHCKNIFRAANYFGAEAQICKTVEEVGELLAVLGRAQNGDFDEENLIEEIADVYNMLDQLCYLFDILRAVEDVAMQKMERTIARIEDGVIHETLQNLDG